MSLSSHRGAAMATRSRAARPGSAAEAGAAVEVLHLRKTYGATVAFGPGAPKEPGGFGLALPLSIAAVFTAGPWIPAIARTTNAASGIGQLLFFTMLFSSGLYVSRPLMGPAMRDIGDWSPSGAAVHALQDPMLGTFPAAQLLLVPAAWAAVFGSLAARFFRWE